MDTDNLNLATFSSLPCTTSYGDYLLITSGTSHYHYMQLSARLLNYYFLTFNCFIISYSMCYSIIAFHP